MIPSCLHVFWSSSCHTLALQGLPTSSLASFLFSFLQPLAHDLFSLSESDVGSSATKTSTKQPRVLSSKRLSDFPLTVTLLATKFKKQHPPPQSNSVECSNAPSNTHTDQLDPCLVCINIYSVHKVLPAVPLMLYTHKHYTHAYTEAIYIDLNRGTIIRRRGIKHCLV